MRESLGPYPGKPETPRPTNDCIEVKELAAGNKPPAFQMYCGDYLKDPQLGMCVAATRGIFMDMICAMYERHNGGELCGTYEQLAQICRTNPETMRAAVADLRDTGAATVTERNGKITLVCRRIQRDSQEAQSNANRQYTYRQRKAAEKKTPTVTETLRENNAPSSSSSSTSVTNTPPGPPLQGGHPGRDLAVVPTPEYPAALVAEILPPDGRPRHARNRGVRSRASPMTFAEMRRQESNRQFWQMVEYDLERKREKLQASGFQASGP